MKNLLFIFLSIILFSCSNEKSNYPWSDMSYEEAINLNTDKIIFLDFYTDNWGACKRLEVETLNDPKILELSEKYLIPIKLDAWYDSTGQQLFSDFNGSAIPLLIFLNGKGEELDRVVGYRDVEDFLEILNNVLNNQDTFMSLSKKYYDGDNDPDLIDKLSLKSDERLDDSLSTELYQKVLNKDIVFNSDVYERALYFFAKKDLKNDNPSSIKTFIGNYINYPESKKLGPAYMDLIRYWAAKKDTVQEISTYVEMINNFINSDIIPSKNKPSFLNSYAWRMSELNQNLQDALNKSNLSIKLIDSLSLELESSKPMFLDTKAEILWKMNKVEEAITVINNAIELDSESQYYKDQKLKFINSKKGK